MSLLVLTIGCVSIPPEPDEAAAAPTTRAATFAGAAKIHAHGYTIVAIPSGVAFGRTYAGKAICAGDAVVGAADIETFAEEHPIRFDADGVHDLGSLGGRIGFAHDGNAGGVIVGTSSIAGPTPGSSRPGHAFLHRDGVMTG